MVKNLTTLSMYLKSEILGKIHKTSILALFIVLVLILNACEKPTEKVTPKTDQALLINQSFNFQTTQQVDVNITAKDAAGKPIRMTNIQVYDKDPDNGGKLLLQAGIDTKGKLSTLLSIPTYVNEVVVVSNYVGVLDKVVVPVKNNSVTYTFTPVVSASNERISATANARISSGKFTYLGSFNNHGVPAYLEAVNDVIIADLLESINLSLPEKQAINPDYLAPGLSRDLSVVKNTTISITFVSEGAAYKNTLGYYTYPLNNPPATAADIQERIVLFPNASFPWSGGNLVSGSKVKFPEIIPANTGIGFFIVVNGFTGTGVSEDAEILYSNPAFNSGSAEQKQHSVLLNSQGKYILGFEDQRRDKASDNDFNDVVFYVTSEVVDAVDEENIPPVETKQDCDNDGIPDADDQYPCDATKAYDNVSAGTLAFEDLWPSKGDFDMNDLVVNYTHNAITNSQNKVVELVSTFDVIAIGAKYKNGFGFELSNLTPSQIASISSTSPQSNLEDGQAKATIMVFNNAFDFVNGDAANGMINTYAALPKVTCGSITVTTTFTSALAMQELGTAPFNPFLVCNQKREYEVHLPGYLPTSKANLAILGTKDDVSQPANGIYYKTKEGMPFALHLPAGTFNYPVEMAAINEAYVKFAPWALSGGLAYTDWYLDLPDYRNPSKIYSK